MARSVLALVLAGSLLGLAAIARRPSPRTSSHMNRRRRRA